MAQIRLAIPIGLEIRVRRPLLHIELAAKGFDVRTFEDERWQPDFGDVMLIQGNLSWYPLVKRQLFATHLDKLPRVIIWHHEPLPPPRASGLAWPWLDHREITKVLLRDRRAIDPYTNYFILRRLHRRGLPHRLLVSTAERVEFLQERGIPAEHLPLGYSPDQGRDLGIKRDIDVLFLGARSLRRRLKLAYLRWRGSEVTALGAWNNPAYWGENRTHLINRAKIFLNIPRFVGQFAMRRFTLGASNKALIVSEPLYNSAPFVPGQHYVAADYREMPRVIGYYLTHEEERKKIVEEGYHLAVEKCLLADSIDKLAHYIDQLSGRGSIENPDSGAQTKLG